MNQFKKAFSIDLRSLALMRVLLGLVLICDLLIRLPWLDDFYSDNGVLPRAALIGEFENAWIFSFHYFSGKYELQLALWMLALLSATALLIGYRTRWAIFISWLLTISMFARNPIVLSGGEDLLRVMLFWCLFLPLNAKYSLDRALSNEGKVENNYFSIFGIFFLLQLIIMYFFTGILKWHPIWQTEASAIYYALHLDEFATPFALWFRELPLWVLSLITKSTLWIELILPFFVFLPFRNSFFRILVPLVFVSFHFGLFLCLQLGTFPWICMIYWTVFLPKEFWDFVSKKLTPPARDLTIIYDGACGFCRRMVLIFKEFLILPNTPFEESRSHPPAMTRMQEEGSWVVSSDGQLATSYSAFLELLKSSPFRFCHFIFSSLPFRICGNKIYKAISKNRSRLGAVMAKMRHDSVGIVRGRFAHTAAALAFVIALFWNVALLNEDDKVTLFKPLYEIGFTMRVHQKWNMFAPYPIQDDGWYVVEGNLKSGKIYDVYNDQEFTLDRPELISATYPNSLWRKYLINLWDKEYRGHRLYFGRYLCRR